MFGLIRILEVVKMEEKKEEKTKIWMNEEKTIAVITDDEMMQLLMRLEEKGKKKYSETPDFKEPDTTQKEKVCIQTKYLDFVLKMAKKIKCEDIILEVKTNEAVKITLRDKNTFFWIAPKIL